MLDEDGSNRALRFALTSVHGRLRHGRFDPQLAPAQQREREQRLTAAPLALLVALLRWPWRPKKCCLLQVVAGCSRAELSARVVRIWRRRLEMYWNARKRSEMV